MTNAHSVTRPSSHEGGIAMRASHRRMRTSFPPASTRSAQAPAPMTKARTTAACAEGEKPVCVKNDCSHSVHSCDSLTTCVLSFRRSEPHSLQTRIAGWIERLCTSYTLPNPSESR
ncbi:MAG: hypothetical protein IJ087_06060 [Eggerthellaceae bacterium]|nr:hypothetical protein [Eggerthellaceae bacterium]